MIYINIYKALVAQFEKEKGGLYHLYSVTDAQWAKAAGYIIRYLIPLAAANTNTKKKNTVKTERNNNKRLVNINTSMYVFIFLAPLLPQ